MAHATWPTATSTTSVAKPLLLSGGSRHFRIVNGRSIAFTNPVPSVRVPVADQELNDLCRRKPGPEELSDLVTFVNNALYGRLPVPAPVNPATALYLSSPFRPKTSSLRKSALTRAARRLMSPTGRSQGKELSADIKDKVTNYNSLADITIDFLHYGQRNPNQQAASISNGRLEPRPRLAFRPG